jgi:hypothetical protein
MYSPTLGRFLQPDPSGSDGSGTNFYAYVGNDPINLADPTGLAADSPQGGSGYSNTSNNGSWLPQLALFGNAASYTGEATTAIATAPAWVVGGGIALITLPITFNSTSATDDCKSGCVQQFVVRAGIMLPKDTVAGTTLTKQGLYGFSVQSAPGVSWQELARGGKFPNPQVSVATAAELETMGYHVMLGTPGRGDYHATVIVPNNPITLDTAEKIRQLFTISTNPAPIPRGR